MYVCVNVFVYTTKIVFFRKTYSFAFERMQTNNIRIFNNTCALPHPQLTHTSASLPP